MRRMAIVAVAALLVSAGLSLAEEQFGVAVYPGATTDAATAAYCATYNEQAVKQAGGTQVSEAACYRTADGFAQVVSYYQHQASLMPLGQPIDQGPQKSALFCQHGMKCASLGDGVDVMVTTPWIVAGSQYTDVLISIRRAEKK